jgi:predicted RNase H-like nuclease
MAETRSSPRNRHRSATLPAKHREDLIDALLCAWTASLRAPHGLDRCQVLGLPAKTIDEPMATIIAPARPRPAPTPNHFIPLSGR